MPSTRAGRCRALPRAETKQVIAAQAIVKDVEGKDYHPDMKLSEQ